MSRPRNNRNNYARPFLKWAGGKGSMVESFDIMGLIPHNFEAYHEPFLGGGAMFFHLYNNDLLHCDIILSDINKEVINLYSVIKDNHVDFIDLLKSFNQTIKSSDFYHYRDEFNELKTKTKNDKSDKLRKAALMLILNKTCYNGLYRENKDGQFNVPFGKFSKTKIFDENNMELVSNALADVKLYVADYSIARKAEKNDFAYFDPPYYPLNETSSFTSYAMNNFDSFDQDALSKLFFELTGKGVKILLSNSSHQYIRDLYTNKNINITPLTTIRYINCKGEKRKPINEYAITNFPILVKDKGHQTSLLNSNDVFLNLDHH